MTGAATTVFSTPFWVVVTRQQISSGNIIDNIKHLFEESGILGFWKGLKGNLIF